MSPVTSLREDFYRINELSTCVTSKLVCIQLFIVQIEVFLVCSGSKEKALSTRPPLLPKLFVLQSTNFFSLSQGHMIVRVQVSRKYGNLHSTSANQVQKEKTTWHSMGDL